MSYILDALKKADQEREQGHVPGLHSQQALPGDAAATAIGPSPLVWAGIGVALTLAGVLTWRQWPSAADPAERAVPSASLPPVSTQPVATLPRPLPATPHPAASADRPAPPANAMPVPISSGLRIEASPSDTPRPWSAQPTLSVEGAPHRTAAVEPARANTPPPSTAPEPAAPLPRLTDLPEATRKELPPLVVGGAMHSPSPAQRMLVLNGQVVHEGDSPQPGLRIEEIRLKSAVLNYRGQRFELQY